MKETKLITIMYHDDMLRKDFSDASDKFDKLLGVAVGHVQANEANVLHGFDDLLEFVQISFARTGRNGDETQSVFVLRSQKSLVIRWKITKKLFVEIPFSQS